MNRTRKKKAHEAMKVMTMTALEVTVTGVIKKHDGTWCELVAMISSDGFNHKCNIYTDVVGQHCYNGMKQWIVTMKQHLKQEQFFVGL